MKVRTDTIRAYCFAGKIAELKIKNINQNLKSLYALWIEVFNLTIRRKIVLWKVYCNVANNKNSLKFNWCFSSFSVKIFSKNVNDKLKPVKHFCTCIKAALVCVHYRNHRNIMSGNWAFCACSLCLQYMCIFSTIIMRII